MICEECGKDDFKESDIVYECLDCEKYLCSACFWNNHPNCEFNEYELDNGKIVRLKELESYEEAA